MYRSSTSSGTSFDGARAAVPTEAAVHLADGVLAGDQRSIARLISALENGNPLGIEAAAGLRQATGKAHTIGVTGPPGSGKSTLVDKLVAIFRKKGHRVGVLAVDPSSPFSGGAILGDRLRMQEHATDSGVFIRSLASRGRLGGLSPSTAACARVLDAAGYDIIFVETVGVGQSEIDIVRMVDTVVLVSVPGLGDDIQVIKAGIMEIGDIFAVNKADRDGADRVVREIRTMLETKAALSFSGPVAGPASGSHHHGLVLGARPLAVDQTGHPVLPPVLKTSAESGEGCEALAEELLRHKRTLAESGELAARRLESARSELRSLLAYRLLDSLEGSAGAAYEESLAKAITRGERDVYEAADLLFAAIKKGELEKPL